MNASKTIADHIKRRALERAIRRHVVAEIAESLKWGGDPDDWDAIGEYRKRARKALRLKLDGLFPEVKP